MLASDKNGGFAFAEAPDCGASAARLMWDHRLDPLTIQATVRRCRADSPEAFDICSLAQPVVILKDALGEDVLIGHGPTAVRLSIGTGTLLEGPVQLTYQLSGRCQLARRLLALSQLEALMRLGRVPRALAVPTSNPDRPRMLLRTLDALAVHRSTRAVAIALFGCDEVERDWMHESDYLRMQTRRLVSRARHLVDGGYAMLVRGTS
jgi:hypothetical protein